LVEMLEKTSVGSLEVTVQDSGNAVPAGARLNHEVTHCGQVDIRRGEERYI
jgi:hypothetical protein